MDEASEAYLNTDKRILKCPPFLHRVYRKEQCLHKSKEMPARKRSNILNTRKSVPSDFHSLTSGLKKRGAAKFFQPASRCLEIGGNTLSSV